MALEDLTGTKYIDDLVATNPAAGDNVSEGDDHIRGIKNVLKTTFPNIDGAVTPTKTTRFNLLDSDSRNAALHFADIEGWFVSDEWENADEEIKKQIAIAKALASLE